MTDLAYDAVLPDDDPKSPPGWRLHIFCEVGELFTQLCEERVLSERVNDPGVHRIMETSARLWLKTRDVRWLRDQLTEILEREELEE